MTNIVTFQGAALDITDLNGQRWLRGPQIAGALGFANAKHISTLFKRNKSEFSPDMTTVVELPTAGGRQMVRIFSPRGAALIAMLAKTERAAAFRAWVLDTLEARHTTAGLPPPPAALEPLLTAEARALLRYRRLGLTTVECARLLGRGTTMVKRATARLRAAGLLPVRPAGSLPHVG